MKKIRTLIAVVMAVMVLQTTVFGAKKTAELAIGILSDVDSAPFIIAQEMGYMPKNVTITIFTSAPNRDSAFQSGSLDGVVSDVLAACLAKAGGFDVKITSQTNGLYKLLVNNKAGIDEVAGLQGMTAAISKNTIIEYALDKMCEAAGFTGDELTKEYIPQIPVRLEMLNANQVTAALLPEPFGSSAELSGNVLLKSSGELGINPGVMVFRTDAITKKSNEIRALYEAYNKAVDYLNETDKEEYIDLIMEKLGYPENIRDFVVLPEYSQAALPPEEEIDSACDWLIGKELIEEAFTFEEITDDIIES